ncbi:MAG: hypothetical protein ACD_39C00758G0003 [uncultured bacterium]|nr:MAG: hypothetical protein ACD_39C00758G0003 [uncultured bacterium]
MNIPLTITVAASRAYTGSDNKRYVELQGVAVGVGVFKTSVPESLVPDQVEGKTCKATFILGVDRNFKFTVRFGGIDGYAS